MTETLRQLHNVSVGNVVLYNGAYFMRLYGAEHGAMLDAVLLHENEDYGPPSTWALPNNVIVCDRGPLAEFDTNELITGRLSKKSTLPCEQCGSCLEYDQRECPLED